MISLFPSLITMMLGLLGLSTLASNASAADLRDVWASPFRVGEASVYKSPSVREIAFNHWLINAGGPNAGQIFIELGRNVAPYPGDDTSIKFARESFGPGIDPKFFDRAALTLEDIKGLVDLYGGSQFEIEIAIEGEMSPNTWPTDWVGRSEVSSSATCFSSLVPFRSALNTIREEVSRGLRPDIDSEAPFFSYGAGFVRTEGSPTFVRASPRQFSAVRSMKIDLNWCDAPMTVSLNASNFYELKIWKFEMRLHKLPE